MPEVADVSKIALPGGNQNQPSSGTYGEKASVNRLKQALPSAPGPAGGGQPTAPASPLNLPTPPPQAQQPTPEGVLPSVLTAPTNRPNESVNTPYSGGPGGGMQPPQTAGQRQLAILDVLRSSPQVNERTREWAQQLFDLYLDLGRQ